MEHHDGRVEMRVLACMVCGDESEFLAVRRDEAESELLCTRCGQARVAPFLGAMTMRRSA